MINIIILSFLLAYREIEHYVKKVSNVEEIELALKNKVYNVDIKYVWNREHFWIKFWEFDWWKWYKVFDSWHMFAGLIVLDVSAALVLTWLDPYFLVTFRFDSLLLTGVVNICFIWYVVFYLRNIGLHWLFRKKGYREWIYLLPPPFNVLIGNRI